jgi:hypothetical protein
MGFCKYIIAVLLIPLLFGSTFAQNHYYMPKKQKLEFGIYLGASNYSGDLEEDIVNVNHTQFGYGGLVRYNFNNYISLKFGLNWGTLEDDDASSSSAWRKKRNLSFRSPIFAGYIAPEFYFAHWRYADKKYVSPYIFAGIGAFHFNPQALYKGVWYDLRPLGTEGQGTIEYPDRQPYDLNQIYIPFGMGFRITLSPTWALSIEVHAAKTFTDYLDDVSMTYASPDVLVQYHGSLAAALADRTSEVMPGKSFPTGGQRGDSNLKDMFFFTGLTFTHTFINKRRCLSF